MGRPCPSRWYTARYPAGTRSYNEAECDDGHQRLGWLRSPTREARRRSSTPDPPGGKKAAIPAPTGAVFWAATAGGGGRRESSSTYTNARSLMVIQYGGEAERRRGGRCWSVFFHFLQPGPAETDAAIAVRFLHGCCVNVAVIESVRADGPRRGLGWTGNGSAVVAGGSSECLPLFGLGPLSRLNTLLQVESINCVQSRTFQWCVAGGGIYKKC